MERTTSVANAKRIMGVNFIGPNELSLIAERMGITIPITIPPITFSIDELKNKSNDYVLFLCVPHMSNGDPICLKTLRSKFGVNPDEFEPCFYNQDWYLQESFFYKSLELKWLLLSKSVLDESRGESPYDMNSQYSFPSAVDCAYLFFVYFFYSNEYLWKNDFVWCNDIDANGDRIYVARYFDPEEISKNGFSIHRHLKIRNNYGCVGFEN